MNGLPPSLESLIQELARFPGIGRKTAQRLGFYLLDSPSQTLEELAGAILALKDNVHECPNCNFIAERELCEICLDPQRDSTMICVVERILDVLIFERMGEYKGLYHVLGGLISPLDGITPDDLNVNSLVKRLPDIQELIIATHPSIEGDTTALYIGQLASKFPVKLTKLARGVPMGSQLEFTDEATLASAYSARIEL